MDKKEAKQFGSWVALIGGIIFLGGAFASIYIAFFMKAGTATHIITTLGRYFHRI